MSLVKAAQQLGIPYVDAKQMLFIFGTPRSKKLHLARSPFDPNKNAAQEFRRARIAEKGHETMKSDEKRERKEKLRKPMHSNGQGGNFSAQCRSYCCPYAQVPAFYNTGYPMHMASSPWYSYSVSQSRPSGVSYPRSGANPFNVPYNLAKNQTMPTAFANPIPWPNSFQTNHFQPHQATVQRHSIPQTPSEWGTM